MGDKTEGNDNWGSEHRYGWFSFTPEWMQVCSNSVSMHWRIQGGRGMASGTLAPPGGSKLFHFHAVFGKKFAK